MCCLAKALNSHKIKRNDILDVAEPLFYSKGYKHTTISDIAANLNIAQGGIYYYFSGKTDILEALIQRHSQMFFEDIQKINASTTSSAQEKLQEILKTTFVHMRNKNGTLLFDFLHKEESLDFMPKLAKILRTITVPILCEIITAGQQTKEFELTHPVAVANIIFALLHSVLISIYEQNQPDASIAQVQLSEQLIDTTLGIKGFRIYTS